MSDQYPLFDEDNLTPKPSADVSDKAPVDKKHPHPSPAPGSRSSGEDPASASKASDIVSTNVIPNASKKVTEQSHSLKMTKADDSGKPNEQPEQDDSDTIEFELDGRLEQTDDGSGASRLHGTIKTKKRKRNKNAERQARFDDNKKAQGLKRIYVYVHPDVAAEVRAFAKQANNRLLGIAE